jgi:hypothetical protein
MLPFTPRLRSVFAYAEAKHPHGVSSLDLLNGILALNGGVAFNLLSTKGFVPVASVAGLRSDESPIAWNECALTALAGAVEEAIRMSHQLVGVEHMLAGILKSPSPELVTTLTQKGVRSDELLSDLRKEL